MATLIESRKVSYYLETHYGAYLLTNLETEQSWLYQTDWDWPSLALRIGANAHEVNYDHSNPDGCIALAIDYLDDHLGLLELDSRDESDYLAD